MIGFAISGIAVEQYAAAPTLSMTVLVSSDEPVHALALRCQVRIDPQRRPYDDATAAGLRDLFGPRGRWVDTLRSLLWMNTSAMVPGFTGMTEVVLPLPLTYDFDVAAAKYLHAVGDGDIHLSLMFSGTAFLRGDTGFSVHQIPWNSDVTHRMPAPVWREAMDQFFPGAGWIRLQRDSLDALSGFKSELGLLSWEETITTLMDKAGVARP